MGSLAKRLDILEPQILANAGKLEKSVYGVVDRVDLIDGIQVPHIKRAWKGTIGNMVASTEEPTILLAEKLEPCILKHKKYKGLYGGRGATKSRFGMDAMIGEVNSVGSKVFCLREKMKSLRQSIYAGINSSIRTLNFAGFTPIPSQWEIQHSNNGLFAFGGLMNVRDMKSLFEFKFFLLEEAEKTSQEAIDILGPTLRGVPGAELWYLWNTGSYNDPMSKEFILPYQEAIDRDGYYEDDYHLIIKISYKDNPWFYADKSLQEELTKDQQKVADGRMSKARYNHIWDGGFNDDIENSLIQEDWFDACIDAHLKLGFTPKGAKIATHDPADIGKDDKAYSLRHGVVFLKIEEIEAHNGNDGFDIACSNAIQDGANVFGWDCDGMGALLRNQCATNFNNVQMHTYMFKGSEKVHFPKAICSATDMFGIHGSKKNEDVFKNKRAQNYIGLAERCRKTWEAVEKGIYHDPDHLISFSSDIKLLNKLRGQLCRLPVKPNNHGLIELYTKEEMRKGILMPDGSRLRLPSPGEADCVMMSFDPGGIINNNVNYRMPPKIRPMGR